MKPLLLINLKTYEQGTGAKALDIAKAADALADKGVEIVLVAQAADIRMISENVRIPVFAQHVDPVRHGSSTGWILPESVKSAGAKGTLLNHSEKRIDLETLRKSLARCREVSLRTVACAETPEKAGEIAALKPDYIAIEPPELIGGDVSVSRARPDVITQSVRNAEPAGVPVLCGAGVKDSADVKKAMSLGARGILVASGVVKSANPEETIRDLLEGFG